MWLLAKLRGNQGFDLNISILKFMGLWPSTADSRKTPLDKIRNINVGLVVGSGILIGAIMLPFAALDNRDDFGIIVECVGVGTMHLTTVVRVLCFYFQADNLKKLTAKVMVARCRDEDGYQNEERRKIVADIQKWINVFAAITFCAIVMFEMGITLCLPSFLSNRRHVTRIWLPVDPYTSPTYEIVFILWYIKILISMPCPPAMEGFIAALLVEIMGQLKLLRHDLSRIREEAVERVRRRRGSPVNYGADDSKSLDTRDLESETAEQDFAALEEAEVKEEMIRLLGEYVDRYQECVQIVQDVEAIFAPIFVTMFVGTVVSLLSAILYSGYNPIASQGNLEPAELEKLLAHHRSTVFMVLGVTASISAEFAALCFMANKVSEGSELVRDSVYNCEWFDATEGFKRSMRIIMSCCNQPLVIKVAAFIPLTMETFLGTMNLAYSYYTTVTTMAYG